MVTWWLWLVLGGTGGGKFKELLEGTGPVGTDLISLELELLSLAASGTLQPEIWSFLFMYLKIFYNQVHGRGIYFAFCAPKGGGKVFKSVYDREEFLAPQSATKNSTMDYFSGKILPQESLVKEMKEILNFLPKEFQKKKYLNFFQKILVVKK